MKCDYCGKEMLRARGCGMSHIVTSDGRRFPRIRFGDLGEASEGERCQDCNAMCGYFHHFGCDNEICPICGDQVISCGCAEFLEGYAK